MTYTFLKPKTTNIWQATWDEVKNKWYFWMSFLLFFIFGFFALIIPFLIIIFVQNKFRKNFWKEFAEVNNWEYQDISPENFFDFSFKGNIDNEESLLMFKEGHSRIISNKISGKIKDRDFKIFCYQFTIGAGKNSRTYHFTVFSFKYYGKFPHIYLNKKGNTWNINGGNQIPLPQEFENKFSLYAPRKYEIEALEIFTIEVLLKLLQKEFCYDVELINQEIFIFTDGQINNFENLEIKFNSALELNDLFSAKLDRFKFEQIGNLPFNLE